MIMKVLFVGLTLVLCIGVGKWRAAVKWDLIGAGEDLVMVGGILMSSWCL